MVTDFSMIYHLIPPFSFTSHPLHPSYLSSYTLSILQDMVLSLSGLGTMSAGVLESRSSDLAIMLVLLIILIGLGVRRFTSKRKLMNRNAALMQQHEEDQKLIEQMENKCSVTDAEIIQLKGAFQEALAKIDGESERLRQLEHRLIKSNEDKSTTDSKNKRLQDEINVVKDKLKAARADAINAQRALKEKEKELEMTVAQMNHLKKNQREDQQKIEILSQEVSTLNAK